MSKPERIQHCEWISITKTGPTECKAMPAKLTRSGKYYCVEFHYAIGKRFKPFEQPAKP